MKGVQTMKPQEYLITFKNNVTLALIDTFYIEAININEARQIADELRHEYDYINYFEISASVEPA